MKKIEPHWDIHETVKAMVDLANTGNETVCCDFNGIELVADPGSTPQAIAAGYMAEVDERYRKWEASPEGQESKRRQEEARKRAEEAKAEGLKPFAIKDRAAWQRGLEKNQEDYGACCYRYAARWANLMEARMATGSTLADCAEATSHEADVEGITGFMYGCSVSILSGVWEHGEALRRWHNLKEQIGTEGEAANEKGTVLNPALLSIGGSA